MIDSSKFPGAKYLPLDREEIKSLIEGKGVRRPAVAFGTWLHIDEMSEEKRPALRQMMKEYPDDMQVYYIKKPVMFGKPGEKYTWCDVPNADPSIGRSEKVGIDEATAISWEVFNQISEDTPDGDEPEMWCNSPEEDGRFRLAWFSGGMWTWLWNYRGMANSMMDLCMEPEQVHKVNRKVTNFFKKAMTRAAKETNADAIGWGDDFGMQKGPFMSPDMFREFYFPYYKELCDLAHSLGLYVFMHCCGDAKLLIPQIIEAGVDVLHPIQKYAMDATEIVREFGDQLAFYAGLDLQQVLPFGTPEEVRQETREFIDIFHQPGKGKVLFTASNRIEDNISAENIIAFAEEAHTYGEQVGKNDNNCK